MKGNPVQRIQVLWWISLLIPVAIIARLADVQLIHHSFYMEKSKEQRTRLLLPAAHRGDIRDRNGRILATMIDTTSIYAVPKSVQDVRETASVISRILTKSEHSILQLLEKNKSFVWIDRKVDNARAEKLREKNLPGIHFLDEQKRVYPHNDLAAPLLGFVGLDNEGLSGVELAYDDILRGKAGRVLIEGDPSGRQIAHGEAQRIQDAERGHDIFLTLDFYLQHVAERVLKKTQEKFRARSISSIVTDAETGEILALVSLPAFDSNRYGDYPPERWRPRPLTDLYEPGSTFKVITVAAGIEEGKVTKETELTFYETIQVGGRTIGNSHPIKNIPPKYSVTDMLCHSINTGAVQIGLKLGESSFYHHIRRFGFGDRLLDGFPGEAKGIFPPPKIWAASDIGMLTFGQSIAITPLQLVHAMASIGNDGKRVRPSLVHTVQQPDGSYIGAHATKVLGESVSPKTAQIVLDMLEQVVVRGSGRRAKMEGYRVGGKTGTAQKVEKGKYIKNKFIASFVGLFPLTDPKIAILVSVDEPKGSIWGETVAAPAVGEIALAAAIYLGIPPDNI